MEQVISIIIMIAVGAFFAWIEKLSKKKAAKTDNRLAAEAVARRKRKVAMPPVPRSSSSVSQIKVFSSTPQVFHDDIPLPEEGIRVTSTSPTPPSPRPSSGNSAISRWRRAIIDAEILAPKFR